MPQDFKDIIELIGQINSIYDTKYIFDLASAYDWSWLFFYKVQPLMAHVDANVNIPIVNHKIFLNNYLEYVKYALIIVLENPEMLGEYKDINELIGVLAAQSYIFKHIVFVPTALDIILELLSLITVEDILKLIFS